jgi:outer membrane immunogenic protein
MLSKGFFAVVGLALLSSPTLAADLIIEDVADVVAAPDGDWTGFYMGLHGGAASAETSYDFEYGGGIYPLAPYDDTQSGSTGILGGQIGYNWDAGEIVFGLQGAVSIGLGGDLEEFDNGDTSSPDFEDTGGTHYDGVVSPSVDWLATFTGKLGYDAGQFVPYVVGGLAVAGITTEVGYASDIGAWDYSSDSDTKVGFVIGAGADIALTDTISLFAEYNYVGLSGDAADPYTINDGIHGDIDVIPDGDAGIHVVKGGLNFKF